MKTIGTSGEDIAVRFLKKAGYKILERNYTTKIGEIDIIAQKEDTIVFAEVKCRTGEGFGNPRDAVTQAKQRKYSLVANQYLAKTNKMGQKARFDVVDILEGRVTHIINAFEYFGY